MNLFDSCIVYVLTFNENKKWYDEQHIHDVGYFP